MYRLFPIDSENVLSNITLPYTYTAKLVAYALFTQNVL